MHMRRPTVIKRNGTKKKRNGTTQNNTIKQGASGNTQAQAHQRGLGLRLRRNEAEYHAKGNKQGHKPPPALKAGGEGRTTVVPTHNHG